jgi:hypothetical protein
MVAMRGEPLGVALLAQNRADDPEPGLVDISQYRVQLKVHLGQRLVHAIDPGSGLLDQGLALAQKGAQRHDGGGGTEAGAQPPHAVEFAQPLAVAHVALASTHVVSVVGVDQQDLKTALLEDLIESVKTKT